MRQKIRKVVSRLTGGWLDERMTRIEMETRLSVIFSRAAATAAIRSIDPKNPVSWEFMGFSQHGEDGIIDYLCCRLKSKSQYFVEIGAADGMENCSSWLALARGYGGVMVEGDPELSEKCQRLLKDRIWNVQSVNLTVDSENVQSLMKLCPYKDPDVFILDIDGIDYYVLKKVLELGYRPKLVVVEYNSVFGPEQPVTVPYQPGFSRWVAHPTGMYYGASIQAWRALLDRHGYRFVTVESTGCNAFFLDPSCFQEEFVANLRGMPFRDNIGDGVPRPYEDASGHLVVPARDWRLQVEKITAMELVRV